jgi:uncharacterized protein (DUF433 family)
MHKQLIVSDPNVMMGKAVIAGTRIRVELILEKLSAGETVEQILKAHPRLTREAVQAALAFAAQRGCEKPRDPQSSERMGGSVKPEGPGF